MKKVLIVGSAGMLGHMVHSHLRSLDKYELRDSSFPVKFHHGSDLLDITDKKAVEIYIRDVKADVVINCIGVLKRGSESDPANAIYINAYFPHQLSKLLAEYGGKLIHISTDCVFSGTKGGYKEDDFKDARDTYGLSKALGEVINDHDLTLRTSIIGPELNKNGEGLFHWFMNQKGKVNGYTSVYWSGVTTLELAKAIDAAIDQNIAGLYHITPGSKIAKHDLLSLMKQVWKRNDIEIGTLAGSIVDKSFINTRDDFNYQVKDYQEMLFELKDFILQNEKLYQYVNLR